MQSPSSPPDPSPPNPQWTILKILKWTTSYFKSHHIDSSRLTAEIFLANVLDVNRIDLYLRFDQPLSALELGEFKKLIRRRVNREPVAYITGSQEFFGINFEVTPDVLIPRPETEFLVEEALKKIPDNHLSLNHIIDIGTGSGAIIVSLATNRPGHHYFASDKAEIAVTIAAKNAKKNGLKDKISFFAGDLFSPLREKNEQFDMILSNPPYIEQTQIAALEPEVRQFEPVAALDGGGDGLAIVRQIILSASGFLKQNGILMLEIGYDQRERVERIITESGNYSGIEFIKDYSGHDRVVVMRKI